MLAVIAVVIAASHSASTAFALQYSTYLGGDNIDWAHNASVDSSGNIIVSGITSGSDFPTTAGAFDRTYNGADDIFVMKLTADLSTLIASTFIGGSEDEFANGLDLDPAGNIVVAGRTDSIDFPATPGAYDSSYNGGWEYDTFVLKLSTSLDNLLSCTYVGGYHDDWASELLVDDSENVVVTGFSNSDDFPITPGAYDSTCEVSSVVVYKLNHDLSELLASTFVGGTQYRSSGFSIVQNGLGEYSVTGTTYTEDFPTTPGAFDGTINGSPDFFVFTISADLTDLRYSTFIGGHNRNEAQDLALDPDGNIVVCGYTTSNDFPVTPGAYDVTFEDDTTWPEPDIVVIKMTPDLSTLLSSTYVGSTYGQDYGRTVAVGPRGDIIVAGSSFENDFPTTIGAYDRSFNGWQDVVLFVMPSDLSTLYYSTYIGGGGFEWPYDVTVNGPGAVVLAGVAGPGFPITEGAYDSEAYLDDGFVCIFDLYDEGLTDIVTGPGPGEINPPLVCTGGSRWMAYGVSKYGVNVACGDLDGDGYDEVITGPGPGAVFGPHVRGWSSKGTALTYVSFLAYGTHRYGVNVSSGDVDGDGMDEIITGAGPGTVFGPHVRGWNVDGGTARPIPGISFLAYGTNKWGVNVACGDIDGDGFEEIITGAGPGEVFGPHVRGWNYDGEGPVESIPAVSYLAYGTNKWGVNVACGDLDGDGVDEIVTGAGPGVIFGSHVRAWKYDGMTVPPIPGVSYFAYPNAAYGVVVSGFDVDGDGKDEILTMPGPDPAQPARVRAWNADGGVVTAVEGVDYIPYYSGITYGGRIAGGRFE
jgi:hypothetical protein